MLRIRLRRTGRKNRPHYRIVVAEHSAPIQGKFVDQLGHYDPRTKAMGLNSETLTRWLSVGAKPSNRVATLLTTAGISHKHIVVRLRTPRPARQAAAETPISTPAAVPATETETPELPTSEPTEPEAAPTE